MATDDQISAVRDMLGPSATVEGWTDEKIGDLIDAGQTNDQIALAYWQGRAARTSSFVDVTESGSSRKLGDIYSNALDMVKYYQGRTDIDTTVVARIGPRTRAIKRV